MNLVAGNLTGDVTDDVTPVMRWTPSDERHRMRRFINDDDDDRRVSLISLLFAVMHNESLLLPNESMTADAHVNVTETPTNSKSAVSSFAEKFGLSVTFGFLPIVAIIGLIINSVVV